MKIAQIAPIVERVPPKKYGGTERVVHHLTEELVKMGHEVTLFASGDSLTSAKLVSVYPKALREVRLTDPYGLNIINLTHIGYAYTRQSEFDIIHDHMGVLSVPTANLSKTPVVYTYHGPFTPEVKRIYNTLRKPYLITISNNQASFAPNLNLIETIYHGIVDDSYPFSKTHDGYLLFVGRISPEKGPHTAIEVAQYMNLPLIIAAKLDSNFPPDIAYFKQYIEPKLSETIQWVGEVDETERNRLMSKAICLLHPVTWPEPFGLVMIEAMATGTPTIAFNMGSIPEVIKNGKTGFVVSDIEGMINAINNIELIDRDFCRQYALEHFSPSRMAEDYVKVYQKILKIEKKKKLDSNLRYPEPKVAYAHEIK